MTIVIDSCACAFTCVLLKAVIVCHGVHLKQSVLVFSSVMSTHVPAYGDSLLTFRPAFFQRDVVCSCIYLPILLLMCIIQVAVDLRSEAKDQVNLLDKSVRCFRVMNED